MFVYTRYNRKAGVYEDPFLQPITKDLYPKLVQRSIILNPEEARRNHAYECDLYYLGTYDEEQGKFDLLDKPEFLCTFSTLEVKEDA